MYSKRVLIATPVGAHPVFPDTYRSIQQLQKYTLLKTGEYPDWDYAESYDCATGRNVLVQTAIDRGYEKILFVDSDMILPPDAIVKFLEDNVEVCLGWYAFRNRYGSWNGLTSICKLGKFDYHDQYSAREVNELRWNGTNLFRIKGGGMGCAFIDLSVFKDKIKYPWFDWVNYKNADHTMLSEDLFFCEQCKWAGIPIYADSRVGPGHIFRIPQTVMEECIMEGDNA